MVNIMFATGTVRLERMVHIMSAIPIAISLLIGTIHLVRMARCTTALKTSMERCTFTLTERPRPTGCIKSTANIIIRIGAVF